jgi:hypothetical protein
MTDVTETAKPVRDRTVIVTVPKDSRLETLLCIAGVTKEKKEAADRAWTEVQDGIFAELTALHPEADIKVYDVQPGPMWDGYTYSYSESYYMPAEKVRAHLSPVWEAFKQVKSSWRLSRKKGR